MNAPRLVSLAFAGLTVGLSFAQNSADNLPVAPLSNFVETYVHDVRAGGHVLVGATVADDTEARFLRPAIFVPPNLYMRNGAICVETVSIDGSYSSVGELSGEVIRSARGTLRYRFGKASPPDGTDFLQALRNFGARNIAVLARPGACDGGDGRNRVIVVNRSADTSGAPKGVRLYVNAGDEVDVEVHFRGRDTQSEDIACVPVDATLRAIAFNLTCTLPGPFAEVTPIELMQRRFERKLTSEHFELIYGSN